MTCWWIVHDLFMTCSWLVQDLFMTCAFFFTTCPRHIHNLFITVASYLKLDWAWHSSAPACFILLYQILLYEALIWKGGPNNHKNSPSASTMQKFILSSWAEDKELFHGLTENTSLVSKGALAHRLQHHSACNAALPAKSKMVNKGTQNSLIWL